MIFSSSLLLTESQKVQFTTTDGEISIRLHKDWAPEGYKRMMALIDSGFFEGQTIFNVDRGNQINFGISTDSNSRERWKLIPDDPDIGIGYSTGAALTKRGYVYFAAPRPNSRNTHLIIADRDGKELGPYERPIGMVTNVDVLDSLYDGYGDTYFVGSGMLRYGDLAIQTYPKLPKIYECSALLSELTSQVLQAKVRSEVAGQLHNVKQLSAKQRQSWLDTVIASPKPAKSVSDTENSEDQGQYIHDQVLRALSKNVVDNLPCVPEPDQKKPARTFVEFSGEHFDSVANQLSDKLIAANDKCVMRLIQRDTGCYGNADFKLRTIEGTFWSSKSTLDSGGQYRVQDGGLQRGKKLCTEDSDCSYLWISEREELGTNSQIGCRLVPECKQVSMPGYNLYKKACRSDFLTFEQARDQIRRQVTYKSGVVHHRPMLILDIFNLLDEDNDDRLSWWELENLNDAVASVLSTSRNARGSSYKRKSEPKSNNVPSPVDRISSTPSEILRQFDRNKDGILSSSEAAMAKSLRELMKEL